MTDQAEPTAPETAAEQDAALVAAQLAADAERDRIAREEEIARREAEAKARRVLAIVDGSGVLVGRKDNPTDQEWDEAPDRLRFPNGFDNALNRYKLAEYEPGRWRFDPIPHDRDKAAENAKAEASILAPLARVVFALSTKAPTRQDDLDALAAYLSTFDAQG